MTQYVYGRAIIQEPDIWNINNPYDLKDGEPCTLEQRIIDAFPEKTVNSVTLSDEQEIATVDMDELTVNEKYLLDNVVDAHKGATPANYTDYLYQHSADGTLWKIFVDNNGALHVEIA